jgi:hypothetical protein
VRRYEKPTAARTHFYAFAAFRAGLLLRLVPLLSIRCPSLSKISSDEEILPELANPRASVLTRFRRNCRPGAQPC